MIVVGELLQTPLRGRRFDAIVVDTAAEHGVLRRWAGADVPAGVFERIVRLAGPADITAVRVDGRRVGGAHPTAPHDRS